MHCHTCQDRPPNRLHAAAGPVAARRGLLAAAALALLLAWPCAALAGGSDEGFINREYPLKALFLYNFGGYVEWPDNAFASDDAPFVICVLGRRRSTRRYARSRRRARSEAGESWSTGRRT